MNKRYMDFVPAKNAIPKGGVVVAKKPVKKPVKKIVKKIPAANPLLDEEIVVEEIFAEKKEPAGVSKGGSKPSVKKDLHANFVKTEVKKRPLGTKKTVKITAAPKVVKKPVAKSATASSVTSGVVTATKRPAPLGQRAKFINTNKIKKRPLSNVGARKTPIVVPKLTEKPKAPEKIISKPEKDSKAGLIIAIILTIILGAAAGTVAFLLLPK